MTIVNDNSRVINKLKTSLTDYTRVVIYDHHMFTVRAIDALNKQAYDRPFEWWKLGNGGIRLGINYSVSNEMKRDE